MTNKQILKKAILKAEKNGYSKYYRWLMEAKAQTNTIIFSHDFAKAFFKHSLGFRYALPNKIPIPKGEKLQELWKWYLQQMVLEKNPIKYLEKYL